MDRLARYICPDCKERKPMSAFHSSSSRFAGISTYCIECTAIRSRAYYIRNKKACIERARVYREVNPDNRKKSHLKVNYGLAIEDHTRMLQEQDFCCAACGVKFSTERTKSKTLACVDHNHKTGDVRALLCGRCNLILGQVEDNVDTLKALIAYLGRFQ